MTAQRLEVPACRVRPLNRAEPRVDGDYVLYWMSAFRRPGWNFALQRAAWWATRLGKGLVVLEALRCDYPYASDRLHRFVLDGMADNAAWFRKRSVTYLPYVEPARGDGKGLLATLADRACLVVADDAPVFFLPQMVAMAAARLPILLEGIDSNGLLPLRTADRDYPSAYAFRRFLQRELPAHLLNLPLADPLAGALPARRPPRRQTIAGPLARRCPRRCCGTAAAWSACPSTTAWAVPGLRGGHRAAERRLNEFLGERLPHYPQRSDPAQEATSGLSPYLHFGQISSHQIFAALAAREGWSVGNLGPEQRGQRQGWWGMSAAAEAFLDQLVTWRELGYNFCAFRDDAEAYAGLPDWARRTLDEHAADPRPYLYTLEELADAASHDPLWNAAQRQLMRQGTIHNYLRMLWGKKILEWSASPRQALAVMLELNNRYALDGRDPNSASGIAWCLGRYDRPWGPERPIFGKIRYMSSENTARKFDVKPYLARFGPN